MDSLSEEKEIIPFNLQDVLDRGEFSYTLLKPNDMIKIYTFLEEIQGEKTYVTISGHVKKPGTYELFQNNMKLYDLIFKSGGFNDPSFKSKTYLERADIYRLTENKINRRIISFDYR